MNSLFTDSYIMAYIFRRESYMLCDYYLVPGIEEGERKKKKKS